MFNTRMFAVTALAFVLSACGGENNDETDQINNAINRSLDSLQNLQASPASSDLPRPETSAQASAPDAQASLMPEAPSTPKTEPTLAPVPSSPKPEPAAEKTSEPQPSLKPQSSPEPRPTVQATSRPEPKPSASAKPRPEASPEPSSEASAKPSPKPSPKPSTEATATPSATPTAKATSTPQVSPEFSPEPSASTVPSPSASFETPEGQPTSTPDPQSLYIREHYPQRDSTIVPSGDEIELRFNKAVYMQGADLSSLFSLTNTHTGELVDFDLSYLSEKIVVLQPKQKLAYKTVYDVEVSAALVAADGTAFAGNSWSFTTLGDVGNTDRKRLSDLCTGRKEQALALLELINNERKLGPGSICAAQGYSEQPSLSLVCPLNTVAFTASFYRQSGKAVNHLDLAEKNRYQAQRIESLAHTSSSELGAQAFFDQTISGADCAQIMHSEFEHFGAFINARAGGDYLHELVFAQAQNGFSLKPLTSNTTAAILAIDKNLKTLKLRGLEHSDVLYSYANIQPEQALSVDDIVNIEAQYRAAHRDSDDPLEIFALEKAPQQELSYLFYGKGLISEDIKPGTENEVWGSNVPFIIESAEQIFGDDGSGASSLSTSWLSYAEGEGYRLQRLLLWQGRHIISKARIVAVQAEINPGPEASARLGSVELDSGEIITIDRFALFSTNDNQAAEFNSFDDIKVGDTVLIRIFDDNNNGWLTESIVRKNVN
ncbi:Ig-like domain-containing protein [Agaribacterium haliotis]|uniref:Ig-like domain-containing protein n=1 Tax=Agaribacterium haliotis TaxID=2013869 RepID=UPI0011783A74|nr:Ig-like domain-containing protein [Agaribacterium haliotis]